jgi:hypothetical protein
MRWAYGITAAVLAGWLITGCGSDAGDQLVLQFLRFQQPPNTQLDSIGATSAQVDVVLNVCPNGSTEPFSNTFATAVFQNNEGADITLDTITIDVTKAGVVPPVVRSTTSPVIGGRCSNDGSKCALNSECLGTCTHTETDVTFLLFDGGGLSPGIKDHITTPGTYDVPITFSGSDGEARFTVRAVLTVDFNDFDHCSSSTSGSGGTGQ